MADAGEILLYSGIIFLCLIWSGLCSGLVLGIMSLDMVGLKILANSGDSKQARLAKAVIPLRSNANFLLVTLILAETIANEAIPLFIHKIFANEILAVCVATVLVVIVGEVIPNSFCSRHGLEVGAYSAWLVRLLKIVFAPIAWPIAWLVNYVLGEELPVIYNRNQLKQLVELHGRGNYGGLRQDEVEIITSTLELSQLNVTTVMTPLSRVFRIDSSSTLNHSTMTEILASGFSRIPIFDQTTGTAPCYLNVKNLFFYDCQNPVGVLSLLEDPNVTQPLLFVPDDTKLVDMLHEFERSHVSIAMVYAVQDSVPSPLVVGMQEAIRTRIELRERTPGTMSSWKPRLEKPAGETRGIVGVVTLEDVAERLIKAKFFDETKTSVSTGTENYVMVPRGSMIRNPTLAQQMSSPINFVPSSLPNNNMAVPSSSYSSSSSSRRAVSPSFVSRRSAVNTMPSREGLSIPLLGSADASNPQN